MEEPENPLFKETLKHRTTRGIKRTAYAERKSRNLQHKKSIIGEIRFSISQENQKILRWLNAYLRR